MSWATLPDDTKAEAQRVLTPTQLRILQDRINGHSWRKIAVGLHLNEATVRGHHARALERMKPYYDAKDAAA